jgi:hypothetical protein
MMQAGFSLTSKGHRRMHKMWNIIGIVLWVFAGALAIALLAREGYCWWTERHTRRGQAAIRQTEDEHYAEMASDAVKEVEKYLRELRERS